MTPVGCTDAACSLLLARSSARSTIVWSLEPRTQTFNPEPKPSTQANHTKCFCKTKPAHNRAGSPPPRTTTEAPTTMATGDETWTITRRIVGAAVRMVGGPDAPKTSQRCLRCCSAVVHLPLPSRGEGSKVTGYFLQGYRRLERKEITCPECNTVIKWGTTETIETYRSDGCGTVWQVAGYGAPLPGSGSRALRLLPSRTAPPLVVVGGDRVAGRRSRQRARRRKDFRRLWRSHGRGTGERNGGTGSLTRWT